ncbi:hypothetical protein BATDEDRAFT_89953 [Batrachochytrium dendrobatidis JAM81]|uniref:Uncharacterized protein n=1 Tax=Batrachochytrium dendrobatidis (strain JAM81 / FGSC 10211) TaxID=684364 RepID=F4P6E9_BATDJ|nr:uncharacterized protein BATDEDRAFT_89953 [Batrachochytrium dendrobatidis JAM81]EGF79335.1 hypothetical protein BATDEDRAFT_89953 [Batrachochytrium dendrobatidis JAM81]|eukprot:XP_006680106.1 hypothetical protein BATDEDRAFT_89953 [Batrachochytrium dendrobatidis JAM81]
MAGVSPRLFIAVSIAYFVNRKRMDSCIVILQSLLVITAIIVCTLLLLPGQPIPPQLPPTSSVQQPMQSEGKPILLDQKIIPSPSNLSDTVSVKPNPLSPAKDSHAIDSRGDVSTSSPQSSSENGNIQSKEKQTKHWRRYVVSQSPADYSSSSAFHQEMKLQSDTSKGIVINVLKEWYSCPTSNKINRLIF